MLQQILTLKEKTKQKKKQKKNMPTLVHSAAGVQQSIGLKGYANQYKVVLGTSAIILMSS